MYFQGNVSLNESLMRIPYIQNRFQGICSDCSWVVANPMGHSLTARGLEAHWGSLPATGGENGGERDSACCVQRVEGPGGEKDT